MSRDIRIAVAERTPERCGEIMDLLVRGEKKLPHFHQVADTFPESERPISEEIILETNPHLLLVNPETAIRRLSVERLKKLKPSLNIVYTCNREDNEITDVIEKGALRREAGYVYTDEKNFSEKLGDIYHCCVNPVKVGIIGFGIFGQRSLFEMSKYIKDGFVEDIRVLSKNIKEEDFKNGVEQFGDRAKHILLTNRVEDLNDREVIIYCSSTLHGKEKVSKRDDRLDLFDYEAKHVYENCKRLAKVNYAGALLMATNPVELLLNVAMKAGLNSQQLTFPFTIDTERLYLSLQEQMIGVEDKTKTKRQLREVLKGLSINKPLGRSNYSSIVLGKHGNPFLPKIEEKTPISDKVFNATLGELIKRAEENARLTGKKSMLASFSYANSPMRTVEFVKELANYKIRPTYTGSILQVFPQSGFSTFSANPLLVDYRDGIRFSLDRPKVIWNPEDIKKRLALYILAEDQYIKEFMKNGRR